MTIDEKYFPGFTQKWIETEPGIVINTLIGGSDVAVPDSGTDEALHRRDH